MWGWTRNGSAVAFPRNSRSNRRGWKEVMETGGWFASISEKESWLEQTMETQMNSLVHFWHGQSVVVTYFLAFNMEWPSMNVL